MCGCKSGKGAQDPSTPAQASAHETQQSPAHVPQNSPILMGASGFRYTIGDNAGNPLAHGRMIIPWPVEDGQDFRGTWQASPSMDAISTTRPTSESPKIGPQLGGGQLSGSRSGDTIRLNLNPHMNDNNVTLVGKIDESGNTLRGTWEWSTFTGVSATGRFAATRAE